MHRNMWQTLTRLPLIVASAIAASLWVLSAGRESLRVRGNKNSGIEVLDTSGNITSQRIQL